MRSLWTWLCVLLVPVASGTCAADDLIGLYRKAAQYDADFLAVVANTEADREEINKARAQFYPKAQLSASRGRGVTDRTTQTALGALDTHLNYSTQNYAFSVRQPLFNKEAFAGYNSARAYVRSQEQLLNEEQGKLMLKVAEAYLQILYTEEKVALLQRRIDAVTRQLDQAGKRYRQGAGTVVEVSEAQASLEMARAEHVQAIGDLEDVRQGLWRMTGEPVAIDAYLDPARLPQEFSTSAALDFWLQSAGEHNPEIMAARYAVEAARQDIEKKRAGHYPSVDLVGVRSYSENDSNNTLGASFDTTTLAVQLSMPLYAGGYVSANVRQAQSRLSAAEETLRSKEREMTVSIRKYFNGIQSQRLSVSAYQQAVSAAEIAFDGASKGFMAGIKTNVEVLDAQQKLYSNRLELSNARYALISNLINLKHRAGLLNEDELAKVSRLFVPSGNNINASNE